MAPQFTATQGPWLRWLQACRARATSSLPVPDSPVMSTGAMLGATFWMRWRSNCMAGDCPAKRSSAAQAAGWMLLSQGGRALQAGVAKAGAAGVLGAGRPSVAEATTRRNCLRSTGLVR